MAFKLLFLSFFISLCGFAADYQVKIHVSNLPDESKPLLLSIFNGNTYMVDSLPHIQNGTIAFLVPENLPSGMFQAVLGTTQYDLYMRRPPRSVMFLLDKENVEFIVDFDDLENSLQVVQSEENRTYFDFQKKDVVFYKKLGLLEQVLLNYPEKNDFYDLATKYYLKHQIERTKLIDSICNANPSSLASRVIGGRKMPIIAGNMTAGQRDSLFKAQFLELVDFSDTALLYTNVYTDKLFQYIEQFISSTAGQRENEKSVMQAVDNIFPHISANDVVRDYLIQFLATSFENMKMEEVLAHISEVYAKQCGSTADIAMQRLEKYKKMAVGNLVPDFTVTDIEDRPVTLYGSDGRYKLIVFWHSECDYCNGLIKGMIRLADKGAFKQHDIHIISVSIDEDKEAWRRYSGENKMGWTNTYTGDLFAGTVAIDYNIFATPTMFLLDSDNKILAKPLTIEDLDNEMKKLNGK